MSKSVPRPTKALPLAPRLLLSHIIVMMVGIATLVTVSRNYSPRLFVLYLQQLEGQGFAISRIRYRLMEGFESAWSRGTIWSVLIGGSTAGGLSYLVAKRIMKPIRQMEKTIQQFAEGHLEARLPASEIPEFNQLATSFNRMATSLEGVEQRRRELVGDLTHELRTPLTVLEGYLEGLSDGTIDSSPEVFQRLVKETTRLRRLVNDLQELSKAEAGYLPIHLQPLEVQPLLSSLIRKFADQLLDEGPTLHLECPNSLPRVKADPERVEQILVNLIGNALQYTAEGSVTVQAWNQPDKVWIAVRDTGQGIAAEDLPHVFERFWRSDRSRTRDSGGSGIGLAISRRLVELQGGEIFVESELDQGSTFRFWLPLA